MLSEVKGQPRSSQVKVEKVGVRLSLETFTERVGFRIESSLRYISHTQTEGTCSSMVYTHAAACHEGGK